MPNQPFRENERIWCRSWRYKVPSIGDRPKLAVLFDGENIPADGIGGILSRLARKHWVCEVRVYGDFNKPELSAWKSVADQLGIEIRHHPRPNRRKKVSDMSMTIDAMDLLYGDKFDVFALATSDGDFAPLVARLKDAGKAVIVVSPLPVSGMLRAMASRFIRIGRK